MCFCSCSIIAMTLNISFLLILIHILLLWARPLSTNWLQNWCVQCEAPISDLMQLAYILWSSVIVCQRNTLQFGVPLVRSGSSGSGSNLNDAQTTGINPRYAMDSYNTEKQSPSVTNYGKIISEYLFWISCIFLFHILKNINFQNFYTM